VHADQAPVEVIVKLVPEAAAPASPAHRALQACAARIGVSLQPLHPSTLDPELATYFITHVDPAALSGILEQLLKCEGVDGAYPKPRGEVP
jgi:hypothetical protein